MKKIFIITLLFISSFAYSQTNLPSIESDDIERFSVDILGNISFPNTRTLSLSQSNIDYMGEVFNINNLIKYYAVFYKSRIMGPKKKRK